MDWQERIAQRRVTKAFIESDSFAAVFHRPFRTKDNQGGFTVQNVDLPAQTVRLVPGGAFRGNPSTGMPSGQLRATNDPHLIGESDLDIRVGDVLEYQENQYRVAMVADDRTVQTVAQVRRLGESAESII